MATQSTGDSTKGSTDDGDFEEHDQANPVISANSIQLSMTANHDNRIPLSLQSIITQSDSSGNQVRLSAPTYANEESIDKAQPPSPKRLSFFRRLFCCQVSSRPSTFTKSDAKESGIQASSRPVYNHHTTVATNKIRIPSHSYGPPGKYPDMGMPSPAHSGKKCLALDLDETLVHSSFQPVDNAHYVIPVAIEGSVHSVYVIKRPGVDDFLKRLSAHYEIIVYTASLSKYADPLLDKLDIHKVISKRLFRENCVFFEGHYVKDLSLLNRDITQTIIVDNSPMSYKFHPENAIDCGTFIDDPTDVEMWQIGDFLVGISTCADVSQHCRRWREWCSKHPTTVPPASAR